MFFFFLLMRRPPPRSTRTDTLFPYTTLFRSVTDQLAIKTEGGIPPKFYLRGKGVVQPNPNIAALSVDLGARDSNPLASSWQWSPALLAQYYFGQPDAHWRPVLGMGVTYTFFNDVKLDRSEEQPSELQLIMRILNDLFFLTK